MKKNVFGIAVLSVMLLFSFGCKNQIQTDNFATENLANENRRVELSQIAVLGNYKVSEDELVSNLSSFLQGKDENSRSAVSNSYNFTKLDSAKIEYEKNSSNRAATVEEYEDSEFYLYQIENQNSNTLGYAVLSNDKRIGEIISIVDNAEFSSDITDDFFMQTFCLCLESYINETVEIWNSLTEEDLINARSAYAYISASGNYKYSNWKYNSGNISNLLSTKWNQEYPYNSAIKAIKGKNYLSGCGTTAVSQIMAFHEYPKTATTNTKNTLNHNWSLAKSWDGTYNWSLIKENKEADKLSTEGKMMVGALMYENAEEMNAKYATKGISIYYSKYVPYLKKRGFKCDSKSKYSFDKIKKSIDNERPILMLGRSAKTIKSHSFLWWKWESISEYGGHAWVIDGYCNMQCTATNKNDKTDVQTFTTNYVHCNLGWGGYKDGYYIDKVFTTNIGANVSDKKVEELARSAYENGNYYHYNLEIITNIRPEN